MNNEIFLQHIISLISFYGAPPHIANFVKVLKHHFTNEHVISYDFPTIWPALSPYLKPYNLFLWGYRKDCVYHDNLVALVRLKESITLHVQNISCGTLSLTIDLAFFDVSKHVR